MWRKLVGTLVIAIALLSGATAESMDDSGTYNVLGAGTKSCGKWMEARKDDSWESLILINWVWGFVTSYNRYVHKGGVGVEGNIDNEGLMAWVDQYCRDNPLENVANASQALIYKLNSR